MTEKIINGGGAALGGAWIVTSVWPGEEIVVLHVERAGKKGRKRYALHDLVTRVTQTDEKR
jgi:hypothetical protein